MQTTAQTALALGLDDGAVLLLHLTTSAIIARLEDPAGVNSPLSALTCPRRTTGTLLWTVDDLGTIRAFSLSSTGGHLLGRSKGAGQGYGAALAVRYTSASTARVLVARFDIRQLDISLASSASLDLAQNIIGEPAAGHASEVRGVEWLNDQGAAFASFAHNDRVVNLWRDNGDLAALTTLDEPPRSIEIRGNVVVAVTVTNEVAIVEIPIDALETDEAGTKKKVVSVPVGSRVGSGVRAARLEDDQLRIARGNELKPVFESVVRLLLSTCYVFSRLTHAQDYRDRSGALLPNIDLGAVTSTALLLDEDGDVNMGAVSSILDLGLEGSSDAAHSPSRPLATKNRTRLVSPRLSPPLLKTFLDATKASSMSTWPDRLSLPVSNRSRSPPVLHLHEAR